MSRLEFNKNGAFGYIDGRVEAKLHTVANTMVGHAKSHAPVRKARRYQKSGVGEMPLKARFSMPKGVEMSEALLAVEVPRDRYVNVPRRVSSRGVVTEAHTQVITGEQRREQYAKAFINRGELVNANVRGTERAFNYRLQIENLAEIKSAVRNEIRHGRSISFNPEQGFQVGGYLKRNIVKDSKVTKRLMTRKISIHSKAPYSVHVEFGTWKAPAQPYFMPAFKYIARLLAEGNG